MKTAYYKVLSSFLNIQGKIVALFFYKSFLVRVYGKNPLYRFFCTLVFLTLSFEAFRFAIQPEIRTPFAFFISSFSAVMLIGFCFYYKFLIQNRENPQYGTVALKRTNGKPALIVSNFYIDNIFLLTTINMFSILGRIIYLSSNVFSDPLLLSFARLADMFFHNIILWILPLFLYIDFYGGSYYSMAKKKVSEVVDSLITTPELIPTKG